MFAIIETSGRQYKVSVGDKIKLDRISEKNENSAEGTKVTFTNVLFVGTSDGTKANIGTPLVSGATVVGKIVEQGKEKKGVAFKKKRRTGYERKVGFRRQYTTVLIDEIKAA